MLAIKIAAVPLALFIVSMAGRIWDARAAGRLAGLPVIAGPILLLLAISEGSAFAAKAAQLSMSAILASEGFNFAYAWTCRRTGWRLSLTLGLFTWLLTATFLAAMPSSATSSAAIAVTAAFFGQAFLPKLRTPPYQATASSGDLLLRMLSGAVLTLIVTDVAGCVGPKWSGLLTVFPVLGCVLAVSCQRAHGSEYVIALFRGMALGRFSFIAFCLILILVLPLQSIPVAFLGAAFVAIAVQTFVLRITRLTPSRAHSIQR